MTPEEKSHLRSLIKAERRLALKDLLARNPGVSRRFRRIEWSEKLLEAERSQWRADSWAALAVAGVSVVAAAMLLFTPKRNTPVHAEIRAESVVLQVAKGMRWTPTPTEGLRLLSMDGAGQVWLPRKQQENDPYGGIRLSNVGARNVRVSELTLSGSGQVLIWPEGSREFELQLQGASAEGHLSGEEAGATLETHVRGDVKTTDIFDEFVRVKSGSSGMTIRAAGDAFALTASPLVRIGFVRRAVEDLESGRHISSVLGGKVMFFEDGGRSESLQAGELVWLDAPRGQVAVRPRGDFLLLSFDGRVDRVTMGIEERWANPSWLAYLQHNRQLALSGWALAAIWGFLWSARQVLRY